MPEPTTERMWSQTLFGRGMVKLRGVELFLINLTSLANMVVRLGIYVSMGLATGGIQEEVR